VVLDLRNVGGNDITAAQRIASCFVPVDTLVGRMRTPNFDNELRTLTPPQYSGALTVLINEQTSGSAELLASCLQENGARLLGSRSAGHPGQMTLVPLSDGSAVQVPAESWYNAAGQPLDEVGVTPEGSL
jgi:carboxyl-terminal processing protease